MSNSFGAGVSSKACECGLINWSGGPGNYKYVSTGEIYDPFIGYEETVRVRPGVKLGCQEKVNANMMSLKEYDTICQYIPGQPGSKFPVEVYNQLLS